MLNSSTPSRDFDGLVGMKAHMEDLEPLLSLDLDEVRMIGIWGPPGIGKTTISRVLFNRVSNRFQLAAIMVNIKSCYPRPCLDDYSAKLQLQNQMLSQMINQKEITISHLGVAKERLKDKKVLLVLDDVDHVQQLEALAKENQCFGPGSRIIITTEDQGILNSHGINHIYKVKFPSNDETFQIFCMHAFGQKNPYEGFYELAQEVAYLADKLPLGLKVLGSALKGRSKLEWERTLPMLKTSLNGEIKSIIKFSYDALDDEYKYLFLYIACFFNDEDQHKVEEILPKKFLHVTKAGIHVLAEKSFISFDNITGYIHMHAVLAQFGREISRKQFVHTDQNSKYQLLIDKKDISEVLSNDKTDDRRFIGMHLSMTEKELKISKKALKRIFINQSCHHFLIVSMQQLKNLKWMDLSFSKDLKELPDLSTAINLEELNLICCGSLRKLPSSIGNATNLQKLDLSQCSKLVKIPSSIENLTNLQKLDLSNCSNLVELPYIGNATKLEKLNLWNCSSLVKLPSSINNATKLEVLNLDNCSSLLELPAIENATKLEELDLNYCSSLLELPPSIGTAKNLKYLNVSGCSSLVNLPSSIGDLTNLDYLNLSHCSNLVELPSSIGNLQRLRYLRMRGCSKLEALPTNINLKSLGILDLTDCSQLKSFPEISTNIKELSLTGTAIKEVPLSILSWSRLSYFRMSYFESLKEFPHALDIITELQLNEDIQEVAPWVKEMSRLRELGLHNCKNLVSLPQFSDSLCDIDADNCQSLERLDCSFNNPEIRLKFRNCFKLNQEARDLIMHTSTSRYAVLPSKQVPACFNHRATAGGLLTIKLNESPLPKSLRFKACIMLVNINEESVDDSMHVDIEIMDKQNDLKVRCTPSGHYIYRFLTEHIYIFEVEAEDVTSTELLFEIGIGYNKKWKIGEWVSPRKDLQFLRKPLDAQEGVLGDLSVVVTRSFALRAVTITLPAAWYCMNCERSKHATANDLGSLDVSSIVRRIGP
ncbi:probable disease resistance protein RPP1 [Capsella rubella]|uniref:probable disease resistance protein RPP1 n=1 Tax=Capsella rubella TaxID=81985 RepID=UPI000CD50AED|nr:probable disease resistance protein RPP1 [Capsella rubella]